MRTQNGIWQREHPGVDDSCFPAQPERFRRLLYQGGGKDVVRRGQRVGDRLSWFAHGPIKASRPQMQERHQLGLAGLQTSVQRLTKEILVPIPLPLVI